MPSGSSATPSCLHAPSCTRLILGRRVPLPPLLPPLQQAELPEVAHALAVREAMAAGDYPLVFRLYASAPNLGRALLDLAIPKLRWAGLEGGEGWGGVGGEGSCMRCWTWPSPSSGGQGGVGGVGRRGWWDGGPGLEEGQCRVVLPRLPP